MVQLVQLAPSHVVSQYTQMSDCSQISDHIRVQITHRSPDTAPGPDTCHLQSANSHANIAQATTCVELRFSTCSMCVRAMIFNTIYRQYHVSFIEYSTIVISRRPPPFYAWPHIAAPTYCSNFKWMAEASCLEATGRSVHPSRQM